MPVGFSDNIDGGGWILVRRVKPGKTWHPATDHLKGTSVYGPSGEQSYNTWSIKFSHMNFQEFLFTTGDGTKWLIASKNDVYKNGSNFVANIRKSSLSPNASSKARWLVEFRWSSF